VTLCTRLGKGAVTTIVPQALATMAPCVTSVRPGKANPQRPQMPAGDGLAMATKDGEDGSAGTELLVIGKGGQFNDTNLVQVYNSTLRSWWVGPPVPTKRKDFGFTVCDGKIFVVGGEGGGFSSVVEVYDPDARSWEAGPSMPTARSGPGLVALGGHIYAVGGGIYEGGWKCFGAMEVLDFAAMHWEVGPPMPTARSKLGIAGVSLGGSMCVLTIGGFAPGQGHLDTLEFYNSGTGGWDLGPRMPTARSALAVATIDSRVLTIGGFAGTCLDTVEILDLATWTWEAGPRMPTARSGLSVAAHDGKVFTMGGFNRCALGTVEILDPTSLNWEVGPSMPMVQPTATGGANFGRQLVLSADDRRPDLVVTIYAKAKCLAIDEQLEQESQLVLSCTNTAGIEVVEMSGVTELERIANFRSTLAKLLQVPQNKLLLGLPDGRLITCSDDTLPLAAIWEVKGTTVFLRSPPKGNLQGVVLPASSTSSLIGREEFAAAVSEAEKRRLKNEIHTLKCQLSETRISSEENIKALQLELHHVRSASARQQALMESEIYALRHELDEARPALERDGANAMRSAEDANCDGVAGTSIRKLPPLRSCKPVETPSTEAKGPSTKEPGVATPHSASDTPWVAQEARPLTLEESLQAAARRCGATHAAVGAFQSATGEACSYVVQASAPLPARYVASPVTQSGSDPHGVVATSINREGHGRPPGLGMNHLMRTGGEKSAASLTTPRSTMVRKDIVEEGEACEVERLCLAEDLRPECLVSVGGLGEEDLSIEIAAAGSGEAPSTERHLLQGEIDTLRAELAKAQATSCAVATAAANKVGRRPDVPREPWATRCLDFGCLAGLLNSPGSMARRSAGIMG